MTKSLPKISVLMPIYNTNESYLRIAIESVLSQTFTDFEFLILNDSPENIRLDEIVRSYLDPRIKYSRNNENLGISSSRNRLIQMAQGVYLAVMDHDDVSLPTRFQKQVKFLDNNRDYGVVGCGVIEEPSGRIPRVWVEDSEIRLAMMGGCAVFHSAAMIRKTILADKKIQYEHEFNPAEDYRLWSRLLGITKFYNIPEVLFKYRHHVDNTSVKQCKRMRDVTLALHSVIELENPVLYREFLLTATHTTRIRLFGFIPLLKILSKGYRTKVYLFEVIVLFSCKKVIKVR